MDCLRWSPGPRLLQSALSNPHSALWSPTPFKHGPGKVRRYDLLGRVAGPGSSDCAPLAHANSVPIAPALDDQPRQPVARAIRPELEGVAPQQRQALRPQHPADVLA